MVFRADRTPSSHSTGIASCVRSDEHPKVHRAMSNTTRTAPHSMRGLFGRAGGSVDEKSVRDLKNSTASPTSTTAAATTAAVKTTTTTTTTGGGGGKQSTFRRTRTLMPPPPFRAPDLRASITLFLDPSALPKDCRPESTDITFKAHLNIHRRLTVDSFEAHNRYWFIHKPLARANAVLSFVLLGVPTVDNRTTGALSPELRAAALYVACNTYRSTYGMAFAGQLKSLYRLSPLGGNTLTDMIMYGAGLSDREDAALDFVHQLASTPSTISRDTRLGLLEGAGQESDQLDRQVSGIAAYAAFLSRAFGALDIELSYSAIKYASANLMHGLQWNPSGRHFSHDSVEDIVEKDMFSHRDSNRSHQHGVRRIPNFISSSVAVPRILTEVGRMQDTWMQLAWIPKPGKLLEMNDCIRGLFGFEPFYLSVSAVLGEPMRRALVYGCKELLFQDGEISRRLKFILCYVSSMHILRSRKRPNAVGGDMQNIKRPDALGSVTAEATVNMHTNTRDRSSRRSSMTVDIEDVVSTRAADTDGPLSQFGSLFEDDSRYDAAAIICAHAAYLACKYGATVAELTAAVDERKVLAAMERYMRQGDMDAEILSYPLGFPLTKKDCAAVLFTHGIVKSPPDTTADHIQYLESAFGSAFKQRVRPGRTCHRATLEIIGATSMWALLERYCAAALSFDIDLSANLYFSGGQAEPTITDFAKGPTGKALELYLGDLEIRSMPFSMEPSVVYRMSSSYARKDRRGARTRGRSASFISVAGDRLNRFFVSPAPGKRSVQ